VLHVSSDNQQHEQGGAEDYPFIELHQFWHVRYCLPLYREQLRASAPAGAF
jgi:hypothetical protein